MVFQPVLHPLSAVQVQAQWKEARTFNSDYLEIHGECESGELSAYRQIANLMQVQ